MTIKQIFNPQVVDDVPGSAPDELRGSGARSGRATLQGGREWN